MIAIIPVVDGNETVLHVCRTGWNEDREFLPMPRLLRPDVRRVAWKETTDHTTLVRKRCGDVIENPIVGNLIDVDIVTDDNLVGRTGDGIAA